MDVCFSGNKEVVTLGPSNGRFWTGCFKRTEKKNCLSALVVNCEKKYFLLSAFIGMWWQSCEYWRVVYEMCECRQQLYNDL